MGFILDAGLLISSVLTIILGDGRWTDYLIAGGMLISGLADLINRRKYIAAVNRSIQRERNERNRLDGDCEHHNSE